MKTANNDTRNLDRLISRVMHEGEQPLPADPWFVRRVVNRLPARRERRLLSLPELLAFIMVVGFCAVIVASEIRSALTLPEEADFDPSKMIAAAGMAAVATLYIAIPVVRRALH